MTNKTIYNLSKDYKKLYSLICDGKIAVGFVDYDWNNKKNIMRDVCAIKKQKGGYISIGVRGMCYASIYPFDLENFKQTEDEYFVILCESINLEFITPTDKDL